MIEEMILDGQPVKYQITIKNNKNTYFYFKSEGYIQINASKHKTRRQIFNYMKENHKSFIKKYNKILKQSSNDNEYQLFGIKYFKKTDKKVNKIIIDSRNRVIIEPDLPTDQLNVLYQNMEKNLMNSCVEELKKKYANNEGIDLSDLRFRTRYMQTRFGSCNPVRKVINLNLFLVRFEKKYLEYVFLHEVAHLVHQNHSKEYYALLSKLSKDYKLLKKELNTQFNNR